MTKDEALKLALEALEGVLDDAPKVLDASIAGGLYEVVQCRDAITAIKEALANDALERKAENARELGLDYEPEQKPVAWMCADESLINKGYARFSHVCMGDWKIPVYTTPPQRKPLTDKEIGAILEDINAFGTRLYTFARAIEAAHGIKENT
jgi:hypothetical protein